MGQVFEARNIQKQRFFEEYMKGDHVLIRLDGRRPGVDVPQNLASSPFLTLKLSYLFQGKTEHDSTAIRAYLRFGGEYYYCVIPWDAIWEITASSGQSQLWKEDLPEDALVQFAKAELVNLSKKIFSKDSPKTEERTEEQKPTKEKSKRQGPILKRIK